MSKVLWVAGSTGAALFLSSCVTYPYDSAFNSCEREANDCYRLCEDIPDEGGYVACQAHCDRDIDRCFDSAYAPYNGYGYGGGGYGGGYGYGSPWYGSYGSWYPNYGYSMSFNYYDRYGYRKRKDRPRDYRPPNNNNPPPVGPPPSGGPRQIDRPRTPNRYYRRTTPPQSGPTQSGPGTAPPRRAVSPPTTPTYTPPSGGTAPTYTPPPSPPPSASPPPRDMPRREPAPRPSDRGEAPARDID